MTSNRYTRKKKPGKPWLPRVKTLIPPGKVMNSKKDYNRKREKNVERFLREG